MTMIQKWSRKGACYFSRKEEVRAIKLKTLNNVCMKKKDANFVPFIKAFPFCLISVLSKGAIKTYQISNNTLFLVTSQIRMCTQETSLTS